MTLNKSVTVSELVWQARRQVKRDGEKSCDNCWNRGGIAPCIGCKRNKRSKDRGTKDHYVPDNRGK